MASSVRDFFFHYIGLLYKISLFKCFVFSSSALTSVKSVELLRRPTSPLVTEPPLNSCCELYSSYSSCFVHANACVASQCQSFPWGSYSLADAVSHSLLGRSRNDRNDLFLSAVQKSSAGTWSGLPVLISLIMEILLLVSASCFVKYEISMHHQMLV